MVSKNQVELGGRSRTQGDSGTNGKWRDSRTLATKNERHRVLTRCRLPGFETYRADKEFAEALTRPPLPGDGPGTVFQEGMSSRSASRPRTSRRSAPRPDGRSEEHTSELQS